MPSTADRHNSTTTAAAANTEPMVRQQQAADTLPDSRDDDQQLNTGQPVNNFTVLRRSDRVHRKPAYLGDYVD